MFKLDCTALPESLIEAELFGHEKGAFTGAHAKRVGRFEQADGATIFLDEIGEFPLQLQAKLLRVLEDQQFERLGSGRTIKVDVRIIAATNRDLAGAVAEGSFRADLYYRLSAFPIVVPPLRERREDIPALVEHIVARSGKWIGKSVQIPLEVMKELEAYDWPGNVRELEHVIERAMIISTGPMLTLGESFHANDRLIGPLEGYRLEDVERAHIVKVLEERKWAVKGDGNAADLLDMNPSTLRSRMKKLGIVRPSGSKHRSPRNGVEWTNRPVSSARLRVARAEGEA
jgi:transcriptional regulator with GAF, ATPase, and Fis domain